MKIVHLCLSCFYIDGYSYQENMLVRQHVDDGHDVVVIASTENFGADRRLTYVTPSVYIGTDGARVIRLPYRRWLPHVIMRKLRMHPGILARLTAENPDAILFHGLSGFELLSAARYKRLHPKVAVYADSHEDARNSARNWLGRLLHKCYYRPIVRRSIAHIDKVLCISTESMEFVESMYGLPADKLEFYPLGGHILSDADYAERRQRTRSALGLQSQEILFLQTGKMTRAKKLLASLKAFTSIPEPGIRLFIAGSIDEEIRQEAYAGIKSDGRIAFLGWKNGNELVDLLCAADVYLQPGTQSATMQMSLCARCPVIIRDVPSHKPFMNGNGWFLRHDDELADIIRHVAEDPSILIEMSKKSVAISTRILDYKTLAARIY